MSFFLHCAHHIHEEHSTATTQTDIKLNCLLKKRHLTTISRRHIWLHIIPNETLSSPRPIVLCMVLAYGTPYSSISISVSTVLPRQYTMYNMNICYLICIIANNNILAAFPLFHSVLPIFSRNNIAMYINSVVVSINVKGFAQSTVQVGI